MAHFEKLFGEKLVDNKGNEYNTATELEGKYVFIYFSAHWCPPCRQFTPMLAKTYEILKKKNTPFEVIFTSRDKSAAEYNDYFSTMPWKSFPSFAGSSPIRTNLDKTYKVSGIPTLILLDKNGELLSKKSRNGVMRDPNGEDFPWLPKKLHQVVDSLSTIGGDEVSIESLHGKHIGVLFGGKWIGQKFISFIQHLNTIREKVKLSGQDFPLIYATLDKTAKDYKDILALLPNDTLVFEFKDDRLEDLADDMGVTTLPNFTILDADGSVLSSNGFAAVNLDKNGEYFPWGPRAIEPLELASNNDLNSSTCAIAFVDENSKEFEKFKVTAEAYYDSFKKGERTEVKFYYSNGEDATAKRMRDVFKVKEIPSLLFAAIPKFLVSNDFDNFETTLNAVVSGNHDQMSSL